MRDESMVGVTDTLQLFPDFKVLQTGKAKGHLNQPEYIFKIMINRPASLSG